MVLNILDFLGDVFRGRTNTTDGEEDVVLEEIFGEDLDVTREGSAEHEGLALMDTGHILSLNDATDLMFETHVKHAVSLVEDEVTDVGETDATAFDEINKAAGSGAQKIAASLDLTQLGVDIGAAVNDSGTDPGTISEFASLVMDLADQLTGGSKDQGGGVCLTGAIVGRRGSVNRGKTGAL